ncbi:hypothetical protein, partial [Methylorubrum populi]|uniref:hypothetical protein n=1 Tax=Methylorubrum populi TaxID=223967 RepID=UPI000DB27A6C
MPSTEDVNLVLRCRELSDIAARARELLGLRMGELGKTNLVYTFKNRIKPPGSILAKVKRKKAEAARNAPDGQASYEPDCQTALNIDPGSASNFDPLDGYGGTPLISPAKA